MFPALGMALMGAATSAYGQHSANKMNMKLAQKQMDFQERMSNTAYTRASKDLENAGLNRILALGNPASSPGGAMATVGNVGSSAMEGASSALQSKTQSLMLKNIKQELRNMEETQQLTAAQADREIALSNIEQNNERLSNMKLSFYLKNPQLMQKDLALGGNTAQQIAGAISELLKGMVKQ